MPPRLLPAPLRTAALRPSVSLPAMARRPMSADHGHESPYDEPSGWLFGVPPNEKPQREWWETTFYWTFCGTAFLSVIAYIYKPDTSIQTWALEEARRRLEAEGVIPDSTKPRKITDELKTVSGK